MKELFEKRRAHQKLSGNSNFVLFVMSAAVSDFYLPLAEKPYQLKSDTTGKLELKLSLTPKILYVN